MAFLLRRLAYMVYVLAGMSLIMFVVSRALPGDPALIYAGEQNVTTERLERARKELGLDRPCPCSTSSTCGTCCTAISAARW